MRDAHPPAWTDYFGESPEARHIEIMYRVGNRGSWADGQPITWRPKGWVWGRLERMHHGFVVARMTREELELAMRGSVPYTREMTEGQVRELRDRDTLSPVIAL